MRVDDILYLSGQIGAAEVRGAQAQCRTKSQTPNHRLRQQVALAILVVAPVVQSA